MSEEEVLFKIEEYAGLFLTPEEIAIILDLDVETFKANLKIKSSKYYIFYMKGKIRSKIDIRKNIILMAKNGSPQAEILASKLMTDQTLAETDL